MDYLICNPGSDEAFRSKGIADTVWRVYMTDWPEIEIRTVTANAPSRRLFLIVRTESQGKWTYNIFDNRRDADDHKALRKELREGVDIYLGTNVRVAFWRQTWAGCGSCVPVKEPVLL